MGDSSTHCKNESNKKTDSQDLIIMKEKTRQALCEGQEHIDMFIFTYLHFVLIL